jgi:undecaprenyl diphosphate synthase
MDGNGRWATRRGLGREFGHRAGAKTFREIAKTCFHRGIETVTVYAFSTENWKRPKHEVDEIMRLLSSYIDEAFSDFNEEDAEVRFIGRREGLSPELQSKMDKLERASAGRHFRLRIALNYGGRDEIVRAANRLIASGTREITEELLSGAMDDAKAPDPDLVVRTGGDYRTSNFLLWQSAYAEYVFTKTLWPDLSVKEIDEILSDFGRRHRRYGGL